MYKKDKAMVQKFASHPLASNGMILCGALLNAAALFLANAGALVAVGCACIAIGAALKAA